ncbi:hypothetical protein AgCh_038771 [Apium graveolens]
MILFALIKSSMKPLSELQLRVAECTYGPGFAKAVIQQTSLKYWNGELEEKKKSKRPRTVRMKPPQAKNITQAPTKDKEIGKDRRRGIGQRFEANLKEATEQAKKSKKEFEDLRTKLAAFKNNISEKNSPEDVIAEYK